MKNKKFKKFLFTIMPLTFVSATTIVTISSQTKKVQSSKAFQNKASFMAPLAMRVNPHNSDLAAFISKLNDATTNKTYEGMLLIPANQKLITNSSFYKTSLVSFKPGTQTFGTNDITILVDKINALSKSAEFTDDQKVMVGKWMLAKYSYTNFFTYKGLPVGKFFTQTQIEASHAGNLVNPLTNQLVLVNNKPLQIVGETGINTSVKAQNANDNVYNISNQGVLDYSVAAWANSSEFKKLLADFNSNIALHKTNPVDMSWKQVFENYANNATKASSIFANLTLPGVSPLGILSNIDTSKFTSDDNTYGTIVSSPVGLALYGNDAAKEVMDYFVGDIATKNTKFEDLTNKILTVLNPLDQKAQDYFANVETNGTDTNYDNESAQEMINFAKLLLSYSNNLSSDVQVRVINDEFDDASRGIFIKTGHNPGIWNSIPVNTICIDRINAGIDVEKTTIVYSEYNKNMGIEKLVKNVYQTSKQYDNNAEIAMLTTPEEQIWHTGEERWGYLTLSLNMNGKETNFTDSKTVSMLIDDHDDDNRAKNVNITQHEICNPYCSLVDIYSDPVPWKISIPSTVNATWEPLPENKDLVAVANIHFMWSDNNTPNDTRPLNALTTSIATKVQTAYQELQNQVNSWKANSSLNPVFDPTEDVFYKITLKDITIDKIVYQTYDDYGYDDTYANNFRFSGIHYTFDEEVDQKY